MTPIVDGRTDCSHIPEPHVVYARRGWRAEVRCACRKVKVAGKRLYGSFDAADTAAKALLTLAQANTQ